jgi:hypothetical protein
MVTTPSVAARTLVRYGCVLCGRRFDLPTGQATLPAHVYPRGLYRGRRCVSTVGIPA